MECAIHDGMGCLWQQGITNGTLPPVDPPKVTLTGKDTDFTLSPMEAQTMKFFGGMMRSESIHQVTHEDLQTSGFDGWWNLVEKLIGCIEWGKGKSTFIAHANPPMGRDGGGAP